jgi:putative phosphoribosyl transferase
MLFLDRNEAARLLARRLGPYRATRPLVLGIPRGGVVVARTIAEELEGELDVVLVRKLRDPAHPEIAIGAIAETGASFFSGDPYVRGLPPAVVEEEKARALAALRWQRARFTPGRSAADPKGRIVIIADDGIATGATVEAALRALRMTGAARLIVAAPVAPVDSIASLRTKADEVICLASSADFGTVSRFFLDFSEVSEDDVVSMLRARARTWKAG